MDLSISTLSTTSARSSTRSSIRDRSTAASCRGWGTRVTEELKSRRRARHDGDPRRLQAANIADNVPLTTSLVQAKVGPGPFGAKSVADRCQHRRAGGGERGLQRDRSQDHGASGHGGKNPRGFKRFCRSLREFGR